MSRCLWVVVGVVVTGGGLTAGCRPYEPAEPVPETAQACCTQADQDLTHFGGCRVARGECRARKGEKFWMRGRVTCGPVDEVGCAGGRCCSYRPMYGAPSPDQTPDPSPDQTPDPTPNPSPEKSGDEPAPAPATSTPPPAEPNVLGS